MLHMQPNEFFSSSLRTYAPPSLAKKKSPVKKKRSIDQSKATDKHIALLNLKVPTSGNASQNTASIPNTFSLRTLKFNQEQGKADVKPLIGYNEALRKFEKKNAEIINTSRSKRSRDPLTDRRQNEDTVNEL